MPTNKRKTIHRSVEERCGNDHEGAGRYLPMMLLLAVPLWQIKLRDAGPAVRAAELKCLKESDFRERLEYVLSKGPKKGDSAHAFNRKSHNGCQIGKKPSGQIQQSLP
jgi:hypothetical protein